MKRETTLTKWVIEDHGGWYNLCGTILSDDGTNGGVVRTTMLERIDIVAGVAETEDAVYRLV